MNAQPPEDNGNINEDEDGVQIGEKPLCFIHVYTSDRGNQQYF